MYSGVQIENIIHQGSPDEKNSPSRMKITLPYPPTPRDCFQTRRHPGRVRLQALSPPARTRENQG